MEGLEALVKRVLERLDAVTRELERFEASLVEGGLSDALRGLVEAFEALVRVYPRAAPYYERSVLLLEYVEALRVRASLYGLRNYFREVEYVESHVRDIRSFVESLASLLGVSQRGGVRGRGVAGRSREYPAV